jgi:hypothetical protein
MKLYRHFSLISLLLCSIAASAQTGIYGTFTAANLNSANTNWIYGPTVGVYFDRLHFGLASAGLDLRGQFLGGGGSAQLNSGLGGARVAITPHVLPIKPYAEALAGVGYVKDPFSGSSTNFEYTLLGGLDLTFFPRLDWRIIEFSYGGISAFDGNLHPKTFSSGIVFRIP